jgi:ATP-dependent Clp protease ATP-binding subunit ClpA
MFERFTHAAREVVVVAQEEAAAIGHDHVGTEHLLLGVAERDSGVLASLGVDRARLRSVVAGLWPDGLDADALATIGIDLEAVRRSVEDSFGPGALTGRGGSRCGRRAGHMPLCPRAKRALERALREALKLGHRHIGAKHVLLGLAHDPESGAALALRRCGTSPEAVRAATLAALRDAA